MLIVSALGLLACEGGSTAQPTAPALLKELHAGQTTRTGLMPSTSRTFPGGVSGWTAPTDATVGWSKHAGHKKAGALVFRPSALGGYAVSPTFPVVPNRRYTAAAWLRGNGTRAVTSVTLDFLNSRGHVILRSHQVGQKMLMTKRWQRSLSAVGYAPTAARTARVGVTATGGGSGPTFVDDVSVQEVSGFAAPLVGPLSTRGPNIVDATGHRVVLRGLEVEGLQNVPQTPVSDMLPQIEAARGWGANYIRIPLNPDYLVGESCVRDPAYLSKIKQVVDYITGHDMLVELDLHIFSIKPCGRPHLVTMPDERAITFWRRIATVFQTNPLVAFNLYNEPHDVSAKIWRDGGTVSDQVADHKPVSYVAVGMQRLYDVVRSTGARNVVFVAGTNYSTQYPAAAPLVGAGNFAYAAHVYTCPTGLPRDGQRCAQKGPGGIDDPTLIMKRFTKVAQHTPVVVNEFGFPDENDGRFDHNVIRFAEHHKWAGWCAFTFDGTTRGMFNLVKNVGPIQDPEVNGMSVMSGLARN